MTTRQHHTTRTGRWLALFGTLSAAGIIAWSAGSIRAQTQPAKTPEEIRREAEQRREEFIRRSQQRNQATPASGVTAPAAAPVGRPSNMREYNERRGVATATRPALPGPTTPPTAAPVRLPGGATPPVTATRPAMATPGQTPSSPGMRLQADDLPDVGDDRLKELERNAAAEAGAPPAPVIPGQSDSGSTKAPGLQPPHPTVASPASRPGGPLATRPAPGGSAPIRPGPRTPGGAQPGGAPPAGAGTSGLNPPMVEGGAAPESTNPKWWLPPEDRPYILSWNDVTFKKTLQDLCDMTGLTVATALVTPADLDSKKITFQSVRLLTFDEALTVYNTLLFDMNYWLVRQKDYLVVRPLSEWYRRIPPDHMFSSLEDYRKAKLPKWEVATVVYAPQYLPADQLANFATDFVPLNAARATPMPSTNRVLITGFVYFIDDQLEIIVKQDVPFDDPRPLRTYQLQYTSVEDAARMLRAMLPQASAMGPSPSPAPAAPATPGAPPTPRAGPTMFQGASSADEVEIQEDVRGDRLLVKATPVKHELVKEYLEKYIDLPLPATTSVRLFEIEHADPDQLVDMIKPLLGKTQSVPMPVQQPGQPPPPAPPGRPAVPPGTPAVASTFTVGTSATILSFPQSRSILVKANKDEMALIERYIKMLDVETGEKDFVYIRLQKASAAGVAGVLREVLAGGRRPGLPTIGQVQFMATSDPTNDKVLILRGEPRDREEAKELIKNLDVDPEAGAVEHVVQLKDADPNTVAEVLRSRFAESGGGARRPSYPGYNPYGGGYGPYGGGGGGGGSSTLPRFIAETGTKTLIVISTEEMWTDIDRLITELDQRSHTRNVTKVYRLKHTSPSNMADILSQAFSGMSGTIRRAGYYPGMGMNMGGGDGSDRPSFQYAPDSDALIVTATDEMHAKAAELIAELDQPGPTDKAQPRPIQLNKAEPEYVANKIEEYFQGGGGRRSGGGYSPYSPYSPYSSRSGDGGDPNKIPVRVVAEEMTNRIFVTASDEDFKKAEELAKSIDAEYEKAEIIRRTFVLKYADPAEVRSIIESMFPDDIASGSRRRRRSWDSGGDYGDYGDYGGGNRRSNTAKPDAVRLIETSDSLIVMAPKAKMEQVANAIAELDTDTAGGNQIKTYKVENAGYEGTAEIARQLGELFNAGGGGGGEWGSGRQSRSKIKFVGDHGSDVLIVSAPAGRMPEIDQRVQEILKLKTPVDLSFVIKHFDVQQARPEDVAEMIEPLLGAKFQELKQKSGGRSGGGWGGWSSYGDNAPKVIAQKNVRRIMVSAPETLMPLVQELLVEFDQPQTPSTTKIVTLETGKADEIIQAVEQALSAGSTGGQGFRSRGRRWQNPWGGDWGGSSSSSAGADDGELHMTAIESSNLILLRGPLDRVSQAEELIKQLDAKATGDGPTINVFKIKYADLSDVQEMIEAFAGEGSSSSDYYSSWSSSRKRSSGDVTVKADYATRSLIVAASRDKLPMVKQIIEMRDQPPPPAEMAGTMGAPVIGYASRGEIAKRYDIKHGDVNETSKKLDEVLLKLYGFDAPYVKAFPFANQIIVSGKPGHFAEVENWLSYFEKNPVEAKYVVTSLLTKKPPEEVIRLLTQSLPPSELQKLDVQYIQNAAEDDPLTALEKQEIKWNTPTVPASQPSSSGPTVQSTGASPFVPTGELNELHAAVAALGLAQVRVTAITRPISDTRPADAGPPVRVTPVTIDDLGADLQILARPAAQPPTTAPAPVATTRPAEPPVVIGARTVSAEDQARDMALQAAIKARETGKVQIRFDAEKKAIYIVGPDLLVESYKKMIEDIEASFDKDRDEAIDTQIRVFQLKNIDVNIAAAILEQMFNDKVQTAVPGQPGQPQAQPQPPQGGPKKNADKDEDEDENSSRRRRREDAKEGEKTTRKGLSSGQRIRVFADARTQSIIVRAAPEDFRAVAELVLKIDRPGLLPAMEIKVFQLRKLNAADVEGAIKDVLKIDDQRNRLMMTGGRSPYGRMGMGGMGMNEAEALIEQLQAQMMQVELQNLAGVNAPPGAEGTGKQYKLNPSKDISVTSDSTTNTVIVTAPREGMALVEKLINTLEDQTIPMTIKTFRIKNGNADQVATQLEQLFQSSGGGGGGGVRRARRGGEGMGGGPFGGFGGMGFGGFTGFEGQRSSEIRISADTRTNTVIVRALEPDMDKIESIISEIDQDSLGAQVVLYTVQSSDAADIAKTLTDTFADGDRGGAQAVRITAVANTNTIVVRAPEAVQQKIGEKLTEIDQKGILPPPKKVVVTYVSASAVAEQLEAIYLGGKQGAIRSGGNRVRIQGDDNTGTIFISAPDELYNQIEETIKTLDQPTRQELKVYKLQYASAPDVLTSFKEMITQLMQGGRGKSGSTNPLIAEQVAASADAKSNSLVVTGSPAVHLVVTSVLAQIDVPSTTRQALIQLKHARAEELAPVLKETYQSIRPTGRDNQPISVTADPNTNTLLIAAGPGDMEGVKEFINQLDAPASLPDEELRIIPLQNIDASETLKIMTEYLRKRNVANRGTANPDLLGGVRLQASATMNALIVSGTPAQIEQIEATVRGMDVADPNAARFKIIPVNRGVDIKDFAARVEKLFNEGQAAAAKDGVKPGRISVMPDYNGPSLIVSGAQQLFPEVEKLVQQLAEQQPGGWNQSAVYIRLKNVRPQDAAQAVKGVSQESK